jgi:NADH-quinone oxidoreductase subunit H
LALVPVVMLAGSFSLVDIVNSQARYPFILVQPQAFIIFLIAATAEAKRIPFDLPEAENELMAGFHTEYSGMRFALYFLGEYVNMITLGALIAVFFLGGWRGPWLPPLLWLILKTLLVPIFLIWTRAIQPRLRYDQLMAFGWKILLPLALANIVITGLVLIW